MPNPAMGALGALSKSQYLQGLQCPKALWLYHNRRDLMAPPFPGLQLIFSRAIVGRLAWKRFPGGRLISENYAQVDRALVSMRLAAKDRVSIVYEAAALSADKEN